MIKLKGFLTNAGISQAEVARRIGISPAAMTNIMNGQWPVTKDKGELQDAIYDAIQSVSETMVWFPPDLFKKVAPDKLQPVRGGSTIATNTEATLEFTMLLRKQTLTPQARKHFNLFRDPFAEDSIQNWKDVFTTPDTRYVSESMWSIAQHGGFMAIVGESGSGKSTLRRMLKDRIVREQTEIYVIEPHVLGMEDNDRKGKTLKATAIAESIITTVWQLEKPKRTPQALYSQLETLLRESSRVGNKHLLIIEEAHCLPLPTLKHLKRFRELEMDNGFGKLLSIILIGQPELKMKLSESNPEVREVTQRIELVELQALDTDLEAYLSHKFKCVGSELSGIIDSSGIEAIRGRMAVNTKNRGKVSLLYPLAVNNFLTACMNLAASIGVRGVDADVVKEV